MAINYTESVRFEYDEWDVKPSTGGATIAKKTGHWIVETVLCELCTASFIQSKVQAYAAAGYLVSFSQPSKPDEAVDMLNTTITARKRQLPT